jgi:hypothetical protein
MFNDVIDDRRQEVAQRLARKRFQRQQEEVVQRLAQEEVAQRLAQERFQQREEAPAPMEQPVTAMPAPTVAQAAAPQPAVVTTDEKERLRRIAQARRSIGI